MKNIDAIFHLIARFFVIVSCTCLVITRSQTNRTRSNQGFIQLPADYNKKGAPIPEDPDQPLIVRISLDVWTITDISAEKMDIELDMYIKFWWPDYRVIINRSEIAPNAFLPIGKEAESLWKPIVHFRNCKGCLPLDLDPNRYTIFYVNQLNAFNTVVRTLMRFTCDIDLRSYPMDRQHCKVQLENYFEDISEIKFENRHTTDYDNIQSNQSLSEFVVEKVMNRDCTPKPSQGKRTFACIEVSILFVRQLGHHIMTMYAPTTFIVLVSWISFWIPADAAPARITLGVTSLLTLATRLDQAQKNLPAVSYVKAIDVWLFACIFLVFASLVEFAIAFYWLRKIKRNSVETHKAPKPAIKVNHSSEAPPLPVPTHDKAAVKPPPDVTIVDSASQIIFPIGFVLFNICYWATYLSSY